MPYLYHEVDGVGHRFFGEAKVLSATEEMLKHFNRAISFSDLKKGGIVKFPDYRDHGIVGSSREELLVECTVVSDRKCEYEVALVPKNKP